MKLAEVSKDDCRLMAQLINMVQIGRYEVGGKDMCAGADALRWLQGLAVEAAECLKNQVVSLPETPPAAPDPPDEGLKVKTYNPGKIGKK